MEKFSFVSVFLICRPSSAQPVVGKRVQIFTIKCTTISRMGKIVVRWKTEEWNISIRITIFKDVGGKTTKTKRRVFF